MKQPAGHGVKAKHSSHKHGGTHKHAAKHHHHHARHHHKKAGPPAGVGKTPASPKPRKLTPDGSVALCSARAVAESLRLALGIPVSDEDVLALYWLTADAADDGASISATVGAAQSYGLAGCRVAGFGVELPDERLLPIGQGSRDWQHVDLGKVDYLVGEAPVHGLILGRLAAVGDEGPEAAADSYDQRETDGNAGEVLPAHGLILGVDLPGPHTVLATADGWWSWGELHDPAEWPDAVIEEAWAVSWC